MAQAKLMNLAREGFGLSLGIFAGFAVYLFVALLFFIPGFLLFNNEQKKSGDKNTTYQVIGVILMAFGVIIGGGLGFGALLDSLSEF